MKNINNEHPILNIKSQKIFHIYQEIDQKNKYQNSNIYLVKNTYMIPLQNLSRLILFLVKKSFTGRNR